jgi:hypothetical protein
MANRDDIMAILAQYEGKPCAWIDAANRKACVVRLEKLEATDHGVKGKLVKVWSPPKQSWDEDDPPEPEGGWIFHGYWSDRHFASSFWNSSGVWRSSFYFFYVFDPVAVEKTMQGNRSWLESFFRLADVANYSVEGY